MVDKWDNSTSADLPHSKEPTVHAHSRDFRFGSFATDVAYLALPVQVRFAPQATDVLRCREMTRWAKRVILQRRETASLSASPTMKNVTDLAIVA